MDLGLDDGVPNERLETIQEILRCRECDNSIDLKMIIEVAGSRDGDNYMSLVKRLIVSGSHNKNQNENGKYMHKHTEYLQAGGRRLEGALLANFRRVCICGGWLVVAHRFRVWKLSVRKCWLRCETLAVLREFFSRENFPISVDIGTIAVDFCLFCRFHSQMCLSQSQMCLSQSRVISIFFFDFFSKFFFSILVKKCNISDMIFEVLVLFLPFFRYFQPYVEHIHPFPFFDDFGTICFAIRS